MLKDHENYTTRYYKDDIYRFASKIPIDDERYYRYNDITTTDFKPREYNYTEYIYSLEEYLLVSVSDIVRDTMCKVIQFAKKCDIEYQSTKGNFDINSPDSSLKQLIDGSDISDLLKKFNYRTLIMLLDQLPPDFGLYLRSFYKSERTVSKALLLYEKRICFSDLLNPIWDLEMIADHYKNDIIENTKEVDYEVQ